MAHKKNSLTKKELAFIETVWDYYEKHGRRALPWRQTNDPYKILVSELMLQQTQVDRVIPKYNAFVKKWPTARRLAAAPLGDVLTIWQGLGYNRRAKFLHEAAKTVMNDRQGHFPHSFQELTTLPGVGPYTAGAVSAFAFNAPVVLIETNVRQVYIHHFFQKEDTVSDKDILPLVEKTLPNDNSKEWYAALMDYGTYLKKEHGNNTSKSKQYKKQSAFKGSDREIRGAILRELIGNQLTGAVLQKRIQADNQRVKAQLKKLCAEGLVMKQEKSYLLP